MKLTPFGAAPDLLGRIKGYIDSYQVALHEFKTKSEDLQAKINALVGKRVSFKKGNAKGKTVWFGTVIFVNPEKQTVGIEVAKGDFHTVQIANIISVD